MADDWFRFRTWSPQIEEEFFRRLARSRSQRDQYLVIQALTIASTFPDVALKLIDQYFATKENDFEDVRALSARVHAYLAQDFLDKTVATMKEILEVERQRPSHRTNMYVEYPYLVATKKIESEYATALATLAERVGDLRFPLDIFKWHAAMSIIHAELKDVERSKRHAGEALDAAEIKKSGFRFHQNLGLVGAEYRATVAGLRKIYLRR